MTYQEEKEAQELAEAQKLVRDYLSVLQNQFYYEDPRRFFAQRDMLVQAITWPTRELKGMEVWLPLDRIRQILDEIILGIKRKGNTANISHFGGYFLICVQSHVQKRKDHLYDEGKTARAKAIGSMPLQEILAGAKVGDDQASAARVADHLLQIATMFKPKRRPKAEKPAPEPPKAQGDQLSLF